MALLPKSVDNFFIEKEQRHVSETDKEIKLFNTDLSWW